MKKQLTIGKFRGLQQISNDNNLFTIVALDHRGSLKRAMNPANPDAITYQHVVEFKLDVTRALAGHGSALLVDSTYGAPNVIASGALPGRTGLVVTLEMSGYDGGGHARRNILDADWTVEKIKRMGGSAVKLLLYYHPQSEAAAFQEEILKQVTEECTKYDIPLILECLSYTIDPEVPKDSPEYAAMKPEIVIETARRLCPIGGDAFKAEFPAEARYEQDEAKMLGWCQELTEAAGVPWMVLSAGVDHDTFCRQVEIACRGGASGFLAGRSMWKDALGLTGMARVENLTGVAAQRLQELVRIAQTNARPWSDWYQADVAEGWSTRYQQKS
jgi:tagatose-1,6-bisphosphate aldolase